MTPRGFPQASQSNDRPVTKSLIFSLRVLARASYRYQSGGLASFNADSSLHADSTEEKSRFTQTGEVIGARISAGVSGRF